ncbi:MAG: T9SS C-terminal target domain-containing protein [Bacteroidetes bacterium]|nr:MAG: T9SS C-terminal target domain-containing protein [Bacteroidota bacterium]
MQGETGIVASTDFSWSPLPNVQTYDLQLATSPDFSPEHIVYQAFDLQESTHTPVGLQLEESTLYFWRVQPSNSCLVGDWSIPSVFQTELSNCERLEATGLPINIPNSGPPATITSPIPVTFSGTISDLNIPLVNITYATDFYSLRLRSPQGEEVLLYREGECRDGNRLTIGFDSDAPTGLNCEDGNDPDLNDETRRRPVESLDAFNGDNTEGSWELELKVAENDFSSGVFRSWSIEFCATLEALSLLLINNDTLFVPPGQSNPLSRDLLQVEDSEQTLSPSAITYTLLTAPAHGNLTNFAGDILTAGSSFTQAAIDAYNIRYTHDDSNTTMDEFYFIAQDDNGAFYPTQRFLIVIDDDAVLNTDDPLEAEPLLRMFPNPARGTTTLQLVKPLDFDLPLKVYDLRAKLVTERILPQGSLQQQLDVSNWPAGTYVLRAGHEVLRLVVE